VALEWNGRQAWLAGVERGTVEQLARPAGAHLTLFRRGESDADAQVFAPLAPALLELHRAVKRVFDPASILNPGRMYEGL
jgi:glycolate oxidase FAD binding subunit